MADKSIRVAKWDNTKAILIFLVVSGHALSSVLDNGEIFRSTFLWLTVFHMPLFMFITGLFSKSFVNAPRINKQKIVFFLVTGLFMKLTLYVTTGLINGFGKFSLLSEKGTPWYIFVTAFFMVFTFYIKRLNKIKILLFSVILALLAGYVSEIGDTLILSRVFTFYPYFFLGYIIDREKILLFTEKIYVKIISAITLIVFTVAVFYLGDSIFSIRYVLSGNNPYSEFGADWAPFGLFLRAGCYIVSVAISFAVLNLVPLKRLPLITFIGSKTLTVYALHRQALYVLQYLVLGEILCNTSDLVALGIFFGVSLLLTIILSLKPFDYVLWPCTNCKKWISPIIKWFKK